MAAGTDVRTGFESDEPHLSAMLKSALDCVVAIDAEGRIIAWNPAAERTFRRPAAEVLLQDMADVIVPPYLREQHRAGIRRYLAGGAPAVLDRRLETVGMRAGGEEFPCELTITRIDVPGDAVFVGYLRDISDRRAADEELRASRTRIVAAADAARRRIERDLHDGAQQRLVSLALTLRLARERVEAGEDVRDLLDEALEDLSATTTELRELARGIHPAVLTEGGLDPALKALVRRCPVPVERTGEIGRRLDPAIEATAYFAAAEALTNAAKYADATRIDLVVGCADGLLALEITDDGRGGADPERGSGLSGIADRASALDGTLAVTTGTGRGTTIRLELPCAS